VILIPVIDLRGGQAVHARLGQREAYRPVRSRLCPGHEPAEVVGALLGLYPFATVYIADIDSIQGRGDNRAAIAAVGARFPSLELWIDSGLATPEALAAWRAGALGQPVVGSESLSADGGWDAILEDAAGDLILSLDFKGDRFLGPPGVLAETSTWPEHVIVMSLGRIGGAEGPDLARVRQVTRRAAGRQVFAAGGVRDADDLGRLAEAGAHGALLATALHDGRIGVDDIARAAAGE
jgi:phosphoribosylformimino-5-aminoimidazole carboxamide ribotide isomerase